MDPESVYQRLKLASDLSDLSLEHRLDASRDPSSEGVQRRQELAKLLNQLLCGALARTGQAQAKPTTD